jgi:hypothetical protein
MKPKHSAGPPMTLGNMRGLGVRGLDVLCRHEVMFSIDMRGDAKG